MDQATIPDKPASAGEDHPFERVKVEAVSKAERRTLSEKREKIFPSLARGQFRKLKWAVMGVTLAIYYLTPWIRWDRGPGFPDQAVLIDLPGRRAYFFFIEIWPQEIYYLTGLLILAAILLFLVTSVAGRVWCGYTCPQTVWTDMFIAVEYLVEGNRNARMRLDKAAWTRAKFLKRALKHAIWVVLAIATGGAWVFYFGDAPTMARDLVAFEASPVTYISIAVLATTTYLLGGLAREQVCIYMCPWPRIQGAMVDEHSLILTYRDFRGEPRGAHKKGASWEGRGDCIDCRQCVAVCPMGIDIRDGAQFECITCALCIDACDTVMDKIGRPRGLIGYDTDANLALRAAGKPTHYRPIRPRTLAYFGIIVLVALVMVIGFSQRTDLDINVLRDRNPLFVTLSDGRIRNGYTLKILNKAYQARTFALAVEGLENADVAVIGGAEDSLDGVRVDPDRLRSLRVTVSVSPAALSGESSALSFVITDRDSGESMHYSGQFLGPK